jgi:hypothetical protein
MHINLTPVDVVAAHRYVCYIQQPLILFGFQHLADSCDTNFYAAVMPY